MNDEPLCEQIVDPSTEVPVEHQATSPVPTFSKQKTFLQNPKVRIVAILLILVIGFSLMTWQVYAKPVTDPFVRKVVQIVPYPALSVEGTTVSMKDFLTEYDSLSRYFESLEGQTAPPADQLEVAIADTLVNKLAIQKLAKNDGITLDQDRVEKYYQDILSSQESEEVFTKNLQETFGWTPEEFKSRIVDSIVLALQMTDAVLNNEELQKERLALIQSASERVKTGEDFETVAKEVHASFNGIESDLGFIQSSVIPESWSSQVQSLEVGDVTEIITLPEGYVIFKLLDRTGEDDQTQLHLLSITVPKQNLEEVVDAYLDTVTVKRYVGEK
ncbi:peptidyl-prolyl cis-trans isomerase [Candidatus Uhrbacteria bacterium]|nr:peptidyl-prolyl cis-trans isomerase [Candidatus Uhrbacteria bacterium]